MLFRKKIDRFCSYCVYAGKLDDETYLCAKRGFVAACHHCRKFKYDPLKRVPKRRKPKDFSEYDELDFLRNLLYNHEEDYYYQYYQVSSS